MEFSRELQPHVLSGAITVSFRLWQRLMVKPGGRYRVGDGQFEIDSIELMPFAFIVESLRRRAAHAVPIHDETLVYRIEFHVVG